MSQSEPTRGALPRDARSRARYRRIMRFATRYMVENWWFELVLPWAGLRTLAARGRTRRWQRMSRNFHDLAADLGGLMIKVGQFLSSRLDVLPPEVTRELEGLQDEVSPEPFADIRALAETELGRPLTSVFAEFDEVPMAAASLGQVHRARLTAEDAAETGFADVVVKVQRPRIETIVAVDLAALRRVAGILSRVRLISRRVDLPSLAEEFAATCREEIDYLHEARAAARFAELHAERPRVRVPEVAWERSTRRVLTLEDVSAIKINDRDALRAAGIDPTEVATAFAGAMFDQLFVDGFFHGDAHPGNMFVEPREGGEWVITFVDFGMMGEVPDTLREGLRRFLIAVAGRDGRGLVAAMRDLGVLLPTADTRELERVVTALFARFGGVSIMELQQIDERELRQFAEEFGETMRTLPFQLPENFLLVIRAISLTSGLASSLDPEFNVWSAVEPYAGQLLRDERGGVVNAFAREAVSVATIAARLPRRLDELATRLEDGEIAVETPRLDRRLRALERVGRRAISAVLFAALLVAGAVLRATENGFGTALMAASALPLLHVLVAGAVGRRDR
jgi:predicted unusual protein kinase regulating ubiquinone biosynthesis (AarF/ABC1/UbiB family)